MLFSRNCAETFGHPQGKKKRRKGKGKPKQSPYIKINSKSIKGCECKMQNIKHLKNYVKNIHDLDFGN